MKKYIVTETQLKMIVDNLVTEQRQLNETMNKYRRTTKKAKK